VGSSSCKPQPASLDSALVLGLAVSGVALGLCSGALFVGLCRVGLLYVVGPISTLVIWIV